MCFVAAAPASRALPQHRNVHPLPHPTTCPTCHILHRPTLPRRYFHIFAFVSSVIPLAFGYPAPAVLPSPLEAALLLAIACGSFGGNLLVNRAFQLELAAKASAVNFAQVGLLHPAFSTSQRGRALTCPKGVVCVDIEAEQAGAVSFTGQRPNRHLPNDCHRMCATLLLTHISCSDSQHRH